MDHGLDYCLLSEKFLKLQGKLLLRLRSWELLPFWKVYAWNGSAEKVFQRRPGEWCEGKLRRSGLAIEET